MKMGKGQQSKRGRVREWVRKGTSMAQEHWTAQWDWQSSRFASTGML